MSRTSSRRERAALSVITVTVVAAVSGAVLAIAGDDAGPPVLASEPVSDRAPHQLGAVAPPSEDAPQPGQPWSLSGVGGPSRAQVHAVDDYLSTYDARMQADAERGDGTYDRTVAWMMNHQHPQLTAYDARDCRRALGRGGPGSYSYITADWSTVRRQPGYAIERGREQGLKPEGAVYTVRVQVRTGTGDVSSSTAQILPFAFVDDRGPYFFHVCE